MKKHHHVWQTVYRPRQYFARVYRAAKRIRAAQKHRPTRSHQRQQDRGFLKLIWQIMADQAGVEILFNTSIVDAVVNQKRLAQVQAVSASQFVALQAKYFIDATGEGDLSFLSGAEYHMGHPENGRTLHMSLLGIREISSLATPPLDRRARARDGGRRPPGDPPVREGLRSGPGFLGPAGGPGPRRTVQPREFLPLKTPRRSPPVHF